MIEKLKPEIKELFGVECPIYNSQALLDTVNQLVDAVNELQTRPENVQSDAESRPENVQDKFAQYRDWAGKLCRFWNIDKDKAIYGILEEVKADWAYRFQMKGENYLFDHCEPISPDDDIIYQGGNNE